MSLGRYQSNVLALLLGILALLVGTLAGWSDVFNALLVSPAPFVRLVLASAAGLLGLTLVLRSAERLGAAEHPVELIRGVRLVFLGVAALAAAAGWLVGSPLPIVAGLVIAGIDVIETSIFLLVTAVRPDLRR